MIYYLIEVCFALSNQLATLFDALSYLRHNKLWVDFAVSFHKGLSELSRHQASAWFFDHDIVSLNNVCDVSWNGCIGTYSVLLHLCNELCLCQVPWRICSSFCYFCRFYIDYVSNLVYRYLFVCVNLPWLNI